MKGFRDEIQKAGAVIVGALKDTYGYLGTVLLVSILWFAAAAAVVFLMSLFIESLLVALPVVIVLTSPLIGAGFYVTNLILQGRLCCAFRHARRPEEVFLEKSGRVRRSSSACKYIST
jgi:uncharacterized membrane protein